VLKGDNQHCYRLRSKPPRLLSKMLLTRSLREELTRDSSTTEDSRTSKRAPARRRDLTPTLVERMLSKHLEV